MKAGWDLDTYSNWLLVSLQRLLLDPSRWADDD